MRDPTANALGKDLYHYEVKPIGTVRPQAIEIDGRESEKLQLVKKLIQTMTSYKPVHRPPSKVVVQETAFIISGERHDVIATPLERWTDLQSPLERRFNM